jgi:hypothetical protein
MECPVLHNLSRSADSLPNCWHLIIRKTEDVTGGKPIAAKLHSVTHNRALMANLSFNNGGAILLTGAPYPKKHTHTHTHTYIFYF